MLVASPARRVSGMLEEQSSRWPPSVAPHLRRWLAKLALAVLDAGAGTQPALAAALLRLGLHHAQLASTVVAIRRVLADPTLTGDAACAPLLRRVRTGLPPGPLRLVRDSTSCRDRVVRLAVGVAGPHADLGSAWGAPDPGRPDAAPSPGAASLPITPGPPGTWHACWRRLLGRARRVLPPGRPVVLRLPRGVCWCRANGQLLPVGALVPACDQGSEWGQRFPDAGWRSASRTIRQPPTGGEPWLLASDLPPGPARVAEDAQRMQIEQHVRDHKRHGWHWEHRRLRDPRRMARVLLVLPLATLWCLTVAMRTRQGAGTDATGSPAGWRRFRLGWHWLGQLLRTRGLLPLPGCPLVPFHPRPG